MTLDQLKDNISFLKRRHAQTEAIDKLLAEYNPDLPTWFPVDMEMEDRLVAAWGRELVDVDGWLPYYIYELDFGEAATSDSVLDADGTPIPLKTVEDLWKLIKEH